MTAIYELKIAESPNSCLFCKLRAKALRNNRKWPAFWQDNGFFFAWNSWAPSSRRQRKCKSSLIRYSLCSAIWGGSCSFALNNIRSRSAVAAVSAEVHTHRKRQQRRLLAAAAAAALAVAVAVAAAETAIIENFAFAGVFWFSQQQNAQRQTTTNNPENRNTKNSHN